MSVVSEKAFEDNTADYIFAGELYTLYKLCWTFAVGLVS